MSAINPISELYELPEFIETTLNPAGCHGPSKNGILNIHNGCFLSPIISYGSARNGLSYTGKVEIIWQADSHGTMGHIAILEGDKLDKLKVFYTQNASRQQLEIHQRLEHKNLRGESNFSAKNLIKHTILHFIPTEGMIIRLENSPNSIKLGCITYDAKRHTFIVTAPTNVGVEETYQRYEDRIQTYLKNGWCIEE